MNDKKFPSVIILKETTVRLSNFKTPRKILLHIIYSQTIGDLMFNAIQDMPMYAFPIGQNTFG